MGTVQQLHLDAAADVSNGQSITKPVLRLAEALDAWSGFAVNAVENPGEGGGSAPGGPGA